MIVMVGVLSSIAADAGYLVLVPLAAAAFHSLGRHPLAGLAAGFSGVAAVFLVNVFVTPDRRAAGRGHQRRHPGGDPTPRSTSSATSTS